MAMEIRIEAALIDTTGGHNEPTIRVTRGQTVPPVNVSDGEENLQLHAAKIRGGLETMLAEIATEYRDQLGEMVTIQLKAMRDIG